MGTNYAAGIRTPSLSEERTRLLLSSRHSEYSVHTALTVPPDDRDGLERLACYSLRAPLIYERLPAELRCGGVLPSRMSLGNIAGSAQGSGSCYGMGCPPQSAAGPATGSGPAMEDGHQTCSSYLARAFASR